MRAALLKLTGLLEVTYYPDRDFFSVRFESVLINLETIFAAVYAAGKQMGREYFPEIIH